MSVLVNFNVIDRYCCNWCPPDLLVYNWPDFEQHVETKHLNIRSKLHPGFPMLVNSGLLPMIAERRRSHHCKKCNQEFVNKNIRDLKSHLKECDNGMRMNTEPEPAAFARPVPLGAPQRWREFFKVNKGDTERDHGVSAIASTVLKAMEQKGRLASMKRMFCESSDEESFDSDATLKIEEGGQQNDIDESDDSDQVGGFETDESVDFDQEGGSEEEEAKEEQESSPKIRFRKFKREVEKEPEPSPKIRKLKRKVEEESERSLKIRKLKREAVVRKRVTAKPTKVAASTSTRKIFTGATQQEKPENRRKTAQAGKKTLPVVVRMKPKPENAASSSATRVIPKKKYIANIVARKTR